MTSDPQGADLREFAATNPEGLFGVTGSTVRVLGIDVTVLDDGSLDLPDLEEVEMLAVLADDSVARRAVEVLRGPLSTWVPDAAENTEEAAVRLLRHIGVTVRSRNVSDEAAVDVADWALRRDVQRPPAPPESTGTTRLT